MKGIVAVLVVLSSFGLVGLYVVRNEVPDVTIVAICATALGTVLGFYFGHVNGEAQATLSSAQSILALAQQRRAGDPASGPTTPLPSPTSSSSTSSSGSDAGKAS